MTDVTPWEEEQAEFDAALDAALDAHDARQAKRPAAQREWIFATRVEREAFARRAR